MNLKDKLRFKRLEDKVRLLEHNIDILVKALNTDRLVKDVNQKYHILPEKDDTIHCIDW